ASGKILDADVIFNGAYSFAVLGRAQREMNSGISRLSTTDGISHEVEVSPEGVIYDLHHVIAHELGHTLGMNDEMERHDALMYKYTAPNDPSMRTPTPDDINGL